MKHFILPVAIALSLIPAAANAENWMITGILAGTAFVDIDSDSIKRSYANLDRISYKIRSRQFDAATVARVNGNCKTGSYRISSGSGGGNTLVSMPQDDGARLHQLACSLPYTTTQPRAR